MKISINRTISFNAFGNIFICLALLLATTLIFHFTTANFIISVILFVIGYLAKRKSVFVVFRPFNSVVESTQNTFSLLKLSYTQEHDMLTVDKTGTKIRILKVGFFSAIVFYFVDKNSQKEKYIVDILVKYQH